MVVNYYYSTFHSRLSLNQITLHFRINGWWFNMTTVRNIGALLDTSALIQFQLIVFFLFFLFFESFVYTNKSCIRSNRLIYVYRKFSTIDNIKQLVQIPNNYGLKKCRAIYIAHREKELTISQRNRNDNLWHHFTYPIHKNTNQNFNNSSLKI